MKSSSRMPYLRLHFIIFLVAARRATSTFSSPSSSSTSWQSSAKIDRTSLIRSADEGKFDNVLAAVTWRQLLPDALQILSSVAESEDESGYGRAKTVSEVAMEPEIMERSTTTTTRSSSSNGITASMILSIASDITGDRHGIADGGVDDASSSATAGEKIPANENSPHFSVVNESSRGNDPSALRENVEGDVNRNADSGTADSEIPTSPEEEITRRLPSVTRGDTDPIETSQNLEYLGSEANGATPPTDVSYGNSSARTSLSPPVVRASQTVYSTMSWLDAFMYQHRGSLWILFNTFFMVIWMLIGGLSLYRLLGLPWCSLYLSRTQYLIIHLLIFTAATFEFVQLIHLSYGSHEGLPLFLTLLLTHTPTPCLAVSLIIMTYCIFVSARLPVVGRYSPPLIYVGILAAFVIVLSFVGDIIVGVSRNSVFLIVCRISLTGLCLACMLAYIFNYRRIVGVALLLRREFRGELKSLAIPLDSPEESQDAKLHLKKVLLTWSRVTLASCVSGVLMCLFSFCLSLFFTASFVPLWAFWVLHSSIFVSQLAVVVSLTFGAAFTLTYSNRRNIFYKYFFPSFPSSSSSDGSFIKRGNFIYQRVSMVNGPALAQIVPSTLVDREEHIPLRNNNIVTELSTPPYRAKVNLKRSATFNCTPPYGFQAVAAPCTSNLYPVLSDHLLSYPNSQFNADLNGPSGMNDIVRAEPYYKPLHLSNSFVNAATERSKYPHYNYARRYPMRSFHSPDQFSSFSSISNNNTHRRSLAASPASPAAASDSATSNTQGLAGTVEALEVRHPSSGAVVVLPPRVDDSHSAHGFMRQIPPYNHSFSGADRGPVNKPEPPEKPARRTEPILVKSVLRDSVNALPIRDTAELDVKSTSPSPADPNNCPLESKPKSLNQSSYFHSVVNSSPVNTRNHGIPGNPVVIQSSYGSVSPPSVSRVAPTFPERSSPFYPTCFTPISSSGSGVRSPAFLLSGRNRETGHPMGAETSNQSSSTDPITSQSGGVKPATGNNGHQSDRPCPRTESPPAFSVSDSDSVAGPSLPHFDTSFSAPKRQSLKRNHSTAGDLTPSHKKSADEGQTEGQDGSVPPDTNGLKYPWYGTWGGRRRSRKRDSVSEEVPPASSGFNLRRLSASKTSLTSLYEKLKKPKKSCKSAVACNQQQEEEEGKDTEEVLFPEGKKMEEEEEFLPRLDEDIDLASEILKSSTVLADFYSLKRSDLKKRKKRVEEAEGEREGSTDRKEEDGNDSEYEDASSSLITNDNDKDSSSTKSLKVDSSDNT